MSAVQVVKSRLQKSRFAYGCVSTWASTPGASCNGSFDGVESDSREPSDVGTDAVVADDDAEEKEDEVKDDCDRVRLAEKRVQSPAYGTRRSFERRPLVDADSDRLGIRGIDGAVFAPVA